MEHFVNAFEIYTVGPKIITRFKDEGLISDAADLFTLKEGDIAGLERFGEKSAENIIASIQSHKQVRFDRFISALGIVNVGEVTAQDLAERFGTLRALQTATLEEINTIENIGDIVAKSVHDYFHQKENTQFIDKLLKNGVEILPVTKRAKGALSGKTFVLTGTLETMSRDEAKDKIRTLGGKATESVSKQTDYLVAGSEPGSKYARAQKLGVTILSEKDFLQLLK
jgi:DNA ligase (NAD+)